MPVSTIQIHSQELVGASKDALGVVDTWERITILLSDKVEPLIIHCHKVSAVFLTKKEEVICPWAFGRLQQSYVQQLTKLYGSLGLFYFRFVVGLNTE